MKLIIIDAHTRWQILSCLIYLETNNEFNESNTTILLQGAPNAIIASTKNIKSFLEKRSEKTILLKRGSLKKEHFSDIHYVVIVTTVNFPLEAFTKSIINIKKIPRIIKVDEGLGSYASRWANIKLGISFYKNKIIGTFHLTSSFLFISILQRIFKVRKQYLLNNLNTKTKQQAINILKETGIGATTDGTVDTIILENPKNPWSPSNNNYLIKKHPHFSKSSSHEQLPTDEYTTEEIAANNKNIRRIIGYNSSSLVYCNALLDIDTYNIATNSYPDNKVSTLIRKHSQQVKNQSN